MLDGGLRAHLDPPRAQPLGRVVGERSGELDAGGTAADDHEGEESSPERWIPLDDGALEPRYDLVAQRDGVVYPAQEEGVVSGARDSEVVRHAAEREHQVAVRDTLSASREGAGDEIDPGHLGLSETGGVLRRVERTG